MNEKRVPALDGLRGVAIGLVLGYHFVYLSGAASASSAFDRGVWRFAGAGWSGVDLFFVLSGFLITGILIDAKAAAGPYFRSFYGRRALRIFPLYYVFLLAVMMALPLIDKDARDAAGGMRENFFWYAAYLANVRPMFHSGISTEFLFAGHLWSLAVEEQFYVVWPLVVLLCSRRGLAAVSVVAIAAALALRIGFQMHGAASTFSYELMPSRMDTLAVGALIALAVRSAASLRLLTRAAPWLGLAAAASLGALVTVRGDLAPPFDGWILTLGLSSLALLFGALLVAVFGAQPGGLVHAIFSHRPLMMLGRYSYALYIVHLPVAVVLMQRFDIVGTMPVVAGSAALGIAAYCALATAISFGLALVTWHVWEQHFLKMKVWFPYEQRESLRQPVREPVPSLGMAAPVAVAVDSLS